jgi:hypothetical protein
MISHSAHTGCATFTITGSTTPSISQLTATPFASTTGPTYAPIQAIHVTIMQGILTMRWRVASNAGILGFQVYANHHRLTNRLIAVHGSRAYRYTALYRGKGPYVLRVLMRSGQVLRVSAG